MKEKKDGGVKWKVSRLKEHPKQASMFGDLPDEELQTLAEDMRKHGQRQPVEILPDGTVLAGHQRVRAAKLLGWEEVEVVVRHDLADDPSAAERFFISDNLVRRHLSPLARARSIQRLMEIERAAGGRYRDTSKEVLKAKLGKQLNLSVRSVNRYLLILAAPHEVQIAFDRGEINLIQAGRVALLKTKEQQELARRLRDGEKAVDVIAEALGSERGRTDSPGWSLRRLVGAIKRESPLLSEVKFAPHRVRHWLPVLRSGAKLLKGLIEQGGRSAP